MLIAHVALPVPIPYTFDYILPKDMNVGVGCRVYVPFGKEWRVGIVVKIDKNTKFPSHKLKTISTILDTESVFSLEVWNLLLWASNYYRYPIGGVLFSAMPVLLRQGQESKSMPICRWFANEKKLEIDIKSLKKYLPEEQKILTMLRHKTIWQNQLAESNFTESVSERLKNQRLIEITHTKSTLYNQNNDLTIANRHSQLNTEQTIAISAICNTAHNFPVWLLESIPGSGKTEVYLHILENILNQGKQTLLMVPEIRLTPKMISRFHNHFNAPVEILHSKLNNKERLRIWLKAKKGEVAVVIGTRSSLFIPFKNLGIIVIDEEHDSSYKQQYGWCYHARNLAVYRAHREKIPIVLGSATPSLETIYNVRQRKYRILRLTRRIGNNRPVLQYVLDLKGQQVQEGLAPALIIRIRQHLQVNNQVILFLNRRGFSSLLCHHCGWIAKCKRCDYCYTFHQSHQILRCHHCNNTHSIPSQCHFCGHTYWMPVGLGTERIEKAIVSFFPNVPISRIDSDTSDCTSTLEQQFRKIHQGGAHILIGTQMLIKRYHFPDVALVALLDVDSSLFSNDFRSTERFAQFYTQITGHIRCIEKQGEVILQTHHPGHPLLKILLQKGYNAFAEQELIERQKMNLPPWTSHVLIRAEDFNNNKVFYFLQQLYNFLRIKTIIDNQVWITSPTPALIPKCRGRYRWQMLIQHTSRAQLQNIINNALAIIDKLPTSKKVKWILDVDPIEN